MIIELIFVSFFSLRIEGISIIFLPAASTQSMSIIKVTTKKNTQKAKKKKMKNRVQNEKQKMKITTKVRAALKKVTTHYIY